MNWDIEVAKVSNLLIGNGFLGTSNMIFAKSPLQFSYLPCVLDIELSEAPLERRLKWWFHGSHEFDGNIKPAHLDQLA